MTPKQHEELFFIYFTSRDITRGVTDSNSTLHVNPGPCMYMLYMVISLWPGCTRYYLRIAFPGCFLTLHLLLSTMIHLCHHTVQSQAKLHKSCTTCSATYVFKILHERTAAVFLRQCIPSCHVSLLESDWLETKSERNMIILLLKTPASSHQTKTRNGINHCYRWRASIFEIIHCFTDNVMLSLHEILTISAKCI
jgi:hypothetical protein